MQTSIYVSMERELESCDDCDANILTNRKHNMIIRQNKCTQRVKRLAMVKCVYGENRMVYSAHYVLLLVHELIRFERPIFIQFIVLHSQANIHRATK